jgi:phage tail sheath protein FI
MAQDYKTPGVYIVENNAFPNSAVAVETAVPVFIGYTQIAQLKGKSILKQATRITSFTEYVSMFGQGFNSKFALVNAPATPPATPPTTPSTSILVNNVSMELSSVADNTAYLYNSIRLFYANGGGPCYILPVGTYQNNATNPIKTTDFIGDGTANSINVFELLLNEPEPTLIVIPDAIALGTAAYTDIYGAVLQHCAKTQSRFGIFDLVRQDDPNPVTQATVISDFRTNIGTNFLNYGAAYYPWVHATVVQMDEVDFRNLDASVDLGTILPEDSAKTLITAYAGNATPTPTDIINHHQSLKALSPTYGVIINEIRNQLNELPPSGAMAGIYTLVDGDRGVWKAPANVSLSMVNAPNINISNDAQESLNVDGITGKSINVIRPFPGIGTLVWGGRTLDGNSQDWRYINVRRTLIMLEQSLKLASRAYVFEPNDANTWITVKSMFINFLTNLWKQGALAGATPDQAFDVQIGLGSTMTGDDILDGKMLISVKVAIVRPAEFIVITFQQQMQQS